MVYGFMARLVTFSPAGLALLSLNLLLLSSSKLLASATPLAPPVAPPTPLSSAVVLGESGGGVPSGFADLSARLLPAVVNISVSAVIRPSDEDDDGQNPDDQNPDNRNPGGQNEGSDKNKDKKKNNGKGPDESSPDGPQVPGFPPGSPLQKFFHDYGRTHGKTPPERQVQALGSGFVIDPSGVIVTNNHVIDKAQQITVIFYDGTELPAKLVGRDSKIDLAVLQVTPRHPLAFVPWGQSDAARIGDWVLAIGNPLGLSGTVTAGIISSRKRNVEHGLYDDFIQTDAAINRGNSGGPLFNTKGEVIGINTLIYGGAGGGSIGLGFAIPSDDARGLVEQMRRTGHVTRGWLGLKFQDVTRNIADALDYTDTDGNPGKGAIIADITKNGPAEKAHLEVGDIFVRINGDSVTGQTLPRLVASHQPGEKITALIWHKSALRKVTLALGHSPEEADPLPSDVHLPAHPVQVVQDFGLKIGVIDAESRTQYALSDAQRGVLVLRVFGGSLAANHGMAEGNVILQVGQMEVNTPDAFLKQIDRAREMKKDAILLLVQDDQGLRWVPLPFVETQKTP